MKLIIIFSLVALLFPVAAPAAALLVNGGFENMTGGLPHNWTYSQGDGPATVQSATASPFNNIYGSGSVSVLLTDGSSTAVTPDLIQSFASQTGGILYAAWDFRMNSLTGNQWGVQIDDSVTSQTFFRMDNGGNFVVENAGGTTTTIMALTTNTWYQVQLSLDLSLKQLSGSITDEFGNVTSINNQMWRILPGSSSLNRVVILDNYLNTSQSGSILFDNFAVDRTPFAPAATPEPSRLVLLGCGLIGLMIRRRRM